MTVSSNPNYSKDRIFDKFMELYDIEGLQTLFDVLLPTSALRSLITINRNNSDETNKDEFCRNLLDLIGDNFLYRLPDGSKSRLKYLRLSLIAHTCFTDNVDQNTIIEKYNETHTNQVSDLEELCNEQHFTANSSWKHYITEEFLDVPESVIITKKEPRQEEETSPLRKRSKLKPLHDYQYQSVNKIINMLSNKNESKKAIFINLPTGAGKTRLTVEAIIEWINLRNQNKLNDAHEQQQNGKIIFWFASTIELCGQAADEFQYIFDSIGIGTEVYLTRLYGPNRRPLTDIINDYKGIHIVVTNTEHFTEKLGITFKNNPSKRYLVDKYHDDPYFDDLRKQTMCVVVDEAHEITSKSYQRFLAAMGFDNSGTNESKINFSRNNIVLIGLSATAYKGSGLEVIFECENDNCNMVFNDPNLLTNHVKRTGHYSSVINNDDDTPEILKNFNVGTKKIFSMFQNNIFVPLPHNDLVISNPVAIIDVPSTCIVGEHIKFSGLDSFDRSSDLTFRWEIRKTSLQEQPVIKNESYFSHSFKSAGQYTIKLRVTSLSNDEKYDEQTITISVKDKGKSFQGTIEDNEKFYDILTKRKILCPITHGVIVGPRVYIDEETKKAIKKNGYDQESNNSIIRDVNYNKNIIEIVKKCMTQYGRKKILIFANSVEHATQLSLIIKFNFKRKFNINSAVVTGTTRPGQRRKIIQDFKDGTINVLVNFGVLTTGFDVPQIDTVIISRLVLSNSLMTQMIGRGQRGTASRGSEDLWLFTSSFIENTNHIKLGWEVTAEQWSPFSKEIQSDLNVITSTTKNASSQSKSVSISKKDIVNFILDIKELKFQCTQCKRQVKGINEIQSFFGIVIPTTPFENFIKNGVFEKITRGAKCKFCRDVNKITENCNCKFTTNFSKIHEFQYHNILIAQHALSLLNSKLTYDEFIKFFETMNINQNQLKNLQSKLDGKIFYVKTFSFVKISEPEKLKNLINLIISQPNYVGNTSSFKSLEADDKTTDAIETIANTPEINFSNISFSDESQQLFSELRYILGHFPTSRQFKKFNKFDHSNSNFEQSYKRNFNLLLSEMKGINIEDDIVLQNQLFDEFFEKCLSEKKVISRTELDEHGQFKIDDYKEIFDSYTNFTSLVKIVLDKVLLLKNENNYSITNILNDYNEVCKLIGSTSPNYEDIFMYSQIGIEKYIQKQIPFSLIPLLIQNIDRYSEKDLEYFLHILVYFSKLRNILGSIPSEHVFLRYLDVHTKSFYQHNFSSFEKFLNQIDIDYDSDIFRKQYIRMEKYVTYYMEKLHNSTKSQQTILQKIINFVISNLDYNSTNLSKHELELAIQIDNFVENKNILNNFL